MLDACGCQQCVQGGVQLLVALLVADTDQQRDATQQDVGGQAVVAVARPGDMNTSNRQAVSQGQLGKPLWTLCSMLAALGTCGYCGSGLVRASASASKAASAVDPANLRDAWHYVSGRLPAVKPEGERRQTYPVSSSVGPAQTPATKLRHRADLQGTTQAKGSILLLLEALAAV